jgi:hypothetical protein
MAAALHGLAAIAKENGKTSLEKGSQPMAAAAPIASESESAAPITIDFGAQLGPSVRLGGAPSLTITDRSGLLVGGFVALAPSRLFSIDLAYEHLDLGAERLGDHGVGSASVTRDAHALWTDLRVFPWRARALELFAGIGIGLAWQGAEASSVVDVRASAEASPRVQISPCSASAPANLALRGNIGVAVPIGGGFMFVSDASFENARLSGELLDGCISGAGTTSVLALRAGLAYRLDVSRLFQ